MLSKKDRSALEHILKYCNEVEQLIQMFNATLETLKTNLACKNSISMSILQIGELTTHLSKTFIDNNTKVPWAKMKKMRNIAAHHYGEFNLNILYDTIILGVPELKKYCLELLAEE